MAHPNRISSPTRALLKQLDLISSLKFAVIRVIRARASTGIPFSSALLLCALTLTFAASSPAASAKNSNRPQPAHLTAGSHILIEDLSLEMRRIEAGTFDMGTASGGPDSERPVTRVTISQPFWLGRTPVTQGQWQAVMGTNPAHLKGENRPVEHVSWTDAMAFARTLTDRERTAGRLPEGYAYTLPTEAQWEYACRAGTTGLYPGNLDAMGWHKYNAVYETHPVAEKEPNAWGLYDMHGNVWELCFDWYALYPGGDITDPTGAPSGSHRVSRGGSYRSEREHCQSAHRNREKPFNRNAQLGFRIALSVSKPPTPAAVSP